MAEPSGFAETTPLERVLADHLLAEECGRAATVEYLLAAHPALAGELTAYFESRRGVPRPWDAYEPGRDPVGDFEPVEVLGRGGMGVVYKARQRGLNRLVALKVMRSDRHAGPEATARLRREAEELARIRHPNVVQVFQAGEDRGNPYFTMEFLEGGSLAARLATGWLPTPRQAAELVRTLAGAVHHVHERGILHRDLKPGNVLLTSDGVPKIADFGLVCRTGDDSDLTQTGAVLGTASYMAPEQAAGKSEEIRAATDVYGLGAILYELLAGRPPFAGASLAETLDQVRHHDPVPLRRLRTRLDPDLETVCLKCLAKPLADRYASAKELADDLERFLAGVQVKARATSVFERLSKAVGQTGLIGHFHASGWLYLVTGAAFTAAHTSVFLALEFAAPEWAVWPLFFLPYLMLFGVFRRQRTATDQPTGWADRQIWPIWGGHALAAAAVLIASRLTHPVVATAIQSAYPALAVLTGLAFFVMGREYWGRHYLHGLLWMACAVAMAVTPSAAPLEAAALTAFCLGQIGVFLLRLGRDDERKSASRA